MELNAGAELDRLGWNPMQPSDECLRHTAQPDWPHYVEQLDRLGIHRKLIGLDLIRRFWPLFRRGTMESTQVRISAATLHALRAEGFDLQSLTMQSYQGWLEELRCWDTGRFVSSLAAFERVESREEARRLRDGLDPAFTWLVLLFERGWTDFEGNRKALKEAVRLCEHQGVLKKQHPVVDGDLDGIEVADEDVHRLIKMITAGDTGRSLFYVNYLGRFCMGAEEARDGINNKAGEIHPVYKPSNQRRDLLPDDLLRPAEADSFLALETEDSEQAIRDMLQDRRDREGLRPGEVVAIDNFMRWQDGASSRSIAEETDVPRATLDRRFSELAKEIWKKLSA